MRIVAIVTTYNEERYVAACLEHYERHGVEVLLLDNDSTDRSVEIASTFLGRNLIGIRRVPRDGYQRWKRMLMLKEQIADELSADWTMHADIDEIRLPPRADQTLASAVEEADRAGYNAINFIEYTFLPTREAPAHDPSSFQQTMRWYYPFVPNYPNRLNLWKRQPQRWPGLKPWLREMWYNRRLRPPSVDLHSSGGHRVKFPGLNMCPVDFRMRHYILMSLDHAIEKYVRVSHDPRDPAGFHRWRATARAEDFQLPSVSQMREYRGDDSLDPSAPLTEHLFVKP